MDTSFWKDTYQSHVENTREYKPKAQAPAFQKQNCQAFLLCMNDSKNIFNGIHL